MIAKLVRRAAIALAVVIITRGASAACNPPKFASTYNPATDAFVYWTTTITDPSAQVVGRIWSNGVDYTGTCNDQQQSFFYFGIVPGNIGLALSLGNACVPPGLCPSGNLNARAWALSNNGRTQETFAHQVPETPAGGVNFDFSDLAATLMPSPRPRVQSSARAGSGFNLTMFPEPIPGDAPSLATVTGCNIRIASGPYPGALATAYPTVGATVTAAGGVCASGTVFVDCATDGIDWWIVYDIVTNAGPDPYVGPPAHLYCDRGLADPKNKLGPKKTAVEVRD